MKIVIKKLFNKLTEHEVDDMKHDNVIAITMIYNSKILISFVHFHDK